MSREQHFVSTSEQETKIRIPTWLYPSTLEVMDAAVPQDNSKSRSEFIERAIRFYAGYVSSRETIEFLPPVYQAALKATIQDTENRIARLLFKLAVELDMVMNVLAAGMEVDDETLKSLRGRCVKNVKQTGGRVSLDDAVEFQRGK